LDSKLAAEQPEETLAAGSHRTEALSVNVIDNQNSGKPRDINQDPVANNSKQVSQPNRVTGENVPDEPNDGNEFQKNFCKQVSFMTVFIIIDHFHNIQIEYSRVLNCIHVPSVNLHLHQQQSLTATVATCNLLTNKVRNIPSI
jgi:hypothetical protein